MSGIGSAPPPPWAFAAVPVKMDIVSNVAAKAFNMFLVPYARAER